MALTVSVLIQFFMYTLVFAMIGVLFLRQSKMINQKDDPRLSRGLQLLQSKIAILETMSDEVENQVKSLNQLLEIKSQEVREMIREADLALTKIEQSKQKSIEVAKIFQDKIPHEEILERQNAKKVVKAARLAHQGMQREEIMQQVGLTRAEVDLIIKMNKDELQFSENELPDWVEDKGNNSQSNVANQDTIEQLFARKEDLDRGSKLPIRPAKEVSFDKKTGLTLRPEIEMPSPTLTNPPKGRGVEVQKVVFPRIG